MTHRFLLLPVCLGLLAVLLGCSRTMPSTDYGPPFVTIAKPIERDVTDYLDFTGRMDSIDAVDVRARVSGYLVKISFQAGAQVKKDEVLFLIDPRPYQADYDKAVAQVALAQAQLKLAIAELARAKDVAKTPGAISQAEIDKRVAQQAEADASVMAAKAQQESAKLNLDFCTVTSPIDGKISRYYVTLGNLVTKDQTLLTTIVSEDPIYAYFDVDERSLLDVQRRIRNGTLKEKGPGEIPVLMALANDTEYTHKGMMDFLNNKVDPFTGTITVRGTFPNPKPDKGPRMYTPGLFTRMRLPIGPPHKAVLVSERAIATDQGQKYVLVVDDKNIVHYRRVKLGPLEDDGLRVILEGVKPDDWVVVSGLQQARPRMEVKPEKLKTMPSTKNPEVPVKDGQQ